MSIRYIVISLLVLMPFIGRTMHADALGPVESLATAADITLVQTTPEKQPLQISSSPDPTTGVLLRFDGVDDELESQAFTVSVDKPWLQLTLRYQLNCRSGGQLLQILDAERKPLLSIFASQEVTKAYEDGDQLVVPASEHEANSLRLVLHPAGKEGGVKGIVQVGEDSLSLSSAAIFAHAPETSPEVFSGSLVLGKSANTKHPWCGDISIVLERLTSEQGQAEFALLRKSRMEEHGGALLLPSDDAAKNGTAKKKNEQQKIQQRLILLGDAGYFDERMNSAILTESLRKRFQVAHVYLGDNIYPLGLEEESHPNHARSLAYLQRLIRLSREAKALPIFIPGNHDWGNAQRTGRIGYESVLRQEKVVVHAFGSLSYAPRHACPGPALRKLHDTLYLIAIDSHWFLHPFDRPTQACSAASEEEALRQLGDMLNKVPRNADIVFATHHPLRTYGTHYRAQGEHCLQEFLCPKYTDMRVRVQKVLAARPPIACIAGHDHSTQLIAGDKACSWYVVAGGVARPDNSFHKHESLLHKDGTHVFVALDRTKDGSVWYRVFGRRLFTEGAAKRFEKQLRKGKS